MLQDHLTPWAFSTGPPLSKPNGEIAVPESYLIQLVSVVMLATEVANSYAIWTYSVSWAGSSAAPLAAGAQVIESGRIALELSSRIDIQDPSKYPTLLQIQSTRIEKPAIGDIQYAYRDFAGAPVSPVRFAFVAPFEQDTFSPVKLLQRPAPGLPWAPLPLITSLADTPAAQQIITAPVETLAQAANPPAAALALEHSSRSILKATHVPILVPQDASGRGLLKRAFVQHLLLQDGEVNAALSALGKGNGALDGADGGAGGLAALLTPFERSSTQTLPATKAFASVPSDVLRAFGEAIATLRSAIVKPAGKARSKSGAVVPQAQARQALARAAAIANKGLAANAVPVSSDFGMLNLERLEMAPAGIERGALIATIPLAPGETTAVVQKEWSVTTKEFTSIVTDSLESISETGVTDNTELSQSTTSQIQHANQFNITGTVSGGIPLISGSSTASFGAQDSGSQSATDSRRHASEITQKASSRTKQEHKVTISTTTVTGTSESTTRQLQNPSLTDPIRIDYFRLMRKWRVRLYRYGLRPTFDIVIPAPAGTLRSAYATLHRWRSQLVPFEFAGKLSDITTDVRPNENNEPHYLWLADQYHVDVPPPPANPGPTQFPNQDIPGLGGGWHWFKFEFTVQDGYRITRVRFQAHIGDDGSHDYKWKIEGVGVEHQGRAQYWDVDLSPDHFLEHATGPQTVTVWFQDAAQTWAGLKIETEPTPETWSNWQSGVFSALMNGAQTLYYAKQQDIAAKVAFLEDKLNSVDTLTLRREENDEIMKGAVRFLLGPGFDFMNSEVDIAIQGSSSKRPPDPRYGQVDPVHGVAFTGSDYLMRPLQQLELQDYEDLVRFINQAIEWENVVTFLYSYFWDMPESWDFIRQIKHPDANRQAFLRAGSARVVLTVRKGWEDPWIRFVDGLGPADSSPRLTIAQEIAAYDSRNYPGIPPANSSEAAVRLQDAIYTTTTTQVPGAGVGVILALESADGFVVGTRVLVDTGVHIGANKFGWQEEASITAIAGNSITLDGLQYAHGGDAVPYAVVHPGEKGALIAEWFEYTPTSGTDIAVTSNLATIS